MSWEYQIVKKSIGDSTFYLFYHVDYDYLLEEIVSFVDVPVTPASESIDELKWLIGEMMEDGHLQDAIAYEDLPQGSKNAPTDK